MAIDDRKLISKALQKRLPRASEPEISALVSHIYENGLYERSGEYHVEFDAELFAVAPRLFPVPQVTGNESPRDKVQKADLLARWLDGKIRIPSAAPAPEEPAEGSEQPAAPTWAGLADERRDPRIAEAGVLAETWERMIAERNRR